VCATERASPSSVRDEDLVFFQNGSMTDASSLGSMSTAPAKLTKRDSGGWKLWEDLAEGRPQFGKPRAFNGNIAQSCWESFTVTLKSPDFFDEMTRFSGNQPGTGASSLSKIRAGSSRSCSLISHTSEVSRPTCRSSGAMRCFRTAWATSSRSPWTRARGRKSFRSSAVTSGSTGAAMKRGELHSLPDAVHHEHVHAACAR
jgi:hypothetical protein